MTNRNQIRNQSRDDLSAVADPTPLRAELPPNVERAAKTIHREVWQASYTPGQGPMHYAGGSYWRTELLRRAARWERLAAAARVCAEFLPGKEGDTNP